ncbi:hypothetical protein M3B46_07900 [Sphingobacterium daejeonense]|uniref:hypothetical protein n=1 Tax=Sphingobacterium daejeonense TaxID=371142 RepID=UPI0021A7BD95|nr:hypothetical protein [Sphingobacterium daejeonense]MCT1530911.1 hypothetical protein [Sphingobacterium daejeonense]
MDKKKKKPYVPPEIKVKEINMEDCSSLSSHVIKGGGKNNEPKIEEWDEDPNGKYKNFDL